MIKPLSILFYFIVSIVSLINEAHAQQNTVEKADKYRSYIYYAFSGLGSNIGSFQPTIRIVKDSFTYNYEQNSYWGKKSKKVEKVSAGKFRQSSIDSIQALVKGLKGERVFKANACIMSGGIHTLIISDGVDTTTFELHNTFDYTALKIIGIINPYLPVNKQLWPTEKMIEDEEECWKYFSDKIKSDSGMTSKQKIN